LHEVASVEREVHDFVSVDNRTHGGIIGLQHRRDGFDADRLGNVADPGAWVLREPTPLPSL
jgi:hypothetical protein